MVEPPWDWGSEVCGNEPTEELMSVEDPMAEVEDMDAERGHTYLWFPHWFSIENQSGKKKSHKGYISGCS